MSQVDRYSRQRRFSQIGSAGQERLRAASIGVAGMGALGTVIADQLVRAGTGRVRIIDRDFVEWSNLQRQTLFDEDDARGTLPKAIAAERKLRRINSEVAIEARVDDLNASNVEAWLDGLDLVLDGLDNFETRFVVNDACRVADVPWVYGAAVGSYGLVFPVLPGGACLRCALPTLPPPGSAPTCDTEGVIGSVTAVVASLEVSQGMRILMGQVVASDVRMTTLDTWTLRYQSIDIPPDPSCPLCVDGNAEYLAAGPLRTVTLCGRNAVQLIPGQGADLDLSRLGRQLEELGSVEANEFLLRFTDPPYELTVFRDGRAIVKGTEEAAVARSVYSRLVGA